VGTYKWRHKPRKTSLKVKAVFLFLKQYRGDLVEVGMPLGECGGSFLRLVWSENENITKYGMRYEPQVS